MSYSFTPYLAPLAPLQPKINFSAPGEFELGGVKFCFPTVQAETTPEKAVLHKDTYFIESYQQTLPPLQPKRVFEFGIFQGGSALFHTLFLNLEKYVCLDICDRREGFEQILAHHQVGERIHTHYNTSQDDDIRVREIFEAEFGDNPPDLVIDDASHLYEPSKRSFEIAFPYLKPGGHYILEDWAWAHWPHYQDPSNGLAAHKALTNLVFELTVLMSSTDLIESIEIRGGYAIIKKRASRFKHELLNIDSQLRLRGRTLQAI